MKSAALLPLLLCLLLPVTVSADGHTGWITARTRHFVFVYEKRDQTTVDELRSFAEEVYAEVTGALGSYPKRIWVVVDGRVDSANGEFVPLPPHLELYITSPSVPVLGTRERSYLRMLLTHELTHYVHLDYDRGLFSVLSRIFGPGARVGDAAFLPGWMTEGIAVNNETDFTTGGRGRNPYFEMIYRALILDDHFFSLDQAGYGSAFPPEGRVYVGGYLMVHYLLDHFGPKTFERIQEQYARFPLFGPWAAIKKVTGESAEQIFGRMERELRARYAKLRTVPQGRLVSPDRIGDYHLPLITGRGWYLYRSNLDGPPAIVRYDPATKRETVVVRAVLTDYTSFSAPADGKRIVFATPDVTLGPAGTSLTSDLFSFDSDTRRTRRITRSAHLWQPALSPDGRLLVAVQRRQSYSRLVLVDQGNGRVSPLFEEHDTTVYNPAFSPDGRLLAFALNDHGRQRIMLLELNRALEAALPAGETGNINTSVARPLPDLPRANAYFPHFAGNDHVLFSADLGAGLALYEAPVAHEGGRLERVAEDPVGVARGELLGNRVLYSSYSSNGYVLRERPIDRVPALREATTASREPAAATREPAADSPEPAVASLEPAASARGPGAAGTRTAGPAEGSAAAAASRRYVDWPRFLFWLPLPLYNYPYLTPSDLRLGAGVVAFGESLLGRSSYTAALSLRPDVMQPALYLSLNSMIGTTTLGYGLIEGYTGSSSSGYTQSISQSLSLSVPLVARYLLGVTNNLSLIPGLSDRIDIESGKPFGFTAPFDAPGSFAFRHAYSVNLGLSYDRIRWGGARDIVPPYDVEIAAEGRYYPPLLSDHGWDSLFRGSLAFPSLLRHQVVRLELASSYSGRPVSTPVTPLVNPRGLFVPSSTTTDPIAAQATPGRSVAGIDYLATLALLDKPLPFGFNLQGFVAGVHLEAAADWNPASGHFTADPYLYAGVELISLVGYYGDSSPLPIGIGVSFRFNLTDGHPFDPLHDIGPYLFIGTNSFQSSSSPFVAQLASGGMRRGATPRPRVDF